MRLARLARSERGASAAEFAMVLPVTLLLFFGIIDGGRYLWAVNRLEKAAQMGTRTAVVTSLVASGMNTQNYVGFACPVYDASGNPTGATSPIKAGEAICKEAVSTTTCSKTAGVVSCKNAQNATVTANPTAFDQIVTRMRVVAPTLADSNVTVTYSGSGIGYAGDPATDDAGGALIDAAPIVTVTVKETFLRTLFLLGGAIRLPTFSYSQSLEDGDGAASY